MMSLWSCLRCAVWSVILAAVAALAWTPGHAAPIREISIGGDAAQAAKQGNRFERGRKWSEAIEHYEAALKAWPDDEELTRGLRRSKIHFGIERRYSDSSFLRSLATLSRTEAFAQFDEVYSKVRAHYVDPVNVTDYIAHGTESLYFALDDDRFIQHNLRGVPRERIAQLRQRLYKEHWNRPVSNAHQRLNELCDLANSETGMSAGPVVMEYIFGGCNALDDYSAYLTPSRLSDLYGNIEGQFVGLGIEMKAVPNRGLFLQNVLPDSPASEGGLLPGEHIVAINGTDCRNMTTDEAANLLQGLEGTRVTLEVVGAGGRLRRTTFMRRAVIVKSIPVARMIDEAHGVGYIQMTGFQKSSPQELDAALQQLHRQGMTSLVWDLRGNPGGLLTSAVEVLDRFIADGVLVSTRGRTVDQNTSYSAFRPGTWNIPLVLVVDGDSASASEIVAGAVRDHHRGTIVGRRTYGKWSVQSIFPVAGQAGLRLTTAKFYSPAGQTLGKIGVRPDITVPEPDEPHHLYRTASDMNVAADADLQKALDVLVRQTAQR
jgi:carboxyl-terminal processing protease